MADLKKIIQRTHEDEDGCIIWEGARVPDGYGCIRHEGIVWKVHRLVWTFINGSIPKGMKVLHTCDKPACVYDKHLYLGTDQDNASDRVERNRQARGVSHACSIFTENDVRQIRLLRSQGLLVKEIASQYQVPVSTVGNICSGHTWGWLA
jgi:hypothetical protein